MKKVQKNDSVKLHYTCTTEDGLKFSSIDTGKPLEFKVGEEKLLKAIETGVIGMKVEDTKIINIEFNEAYGPVQKELIQEVSNNALPNDLKPEVGMQLVSTNPKGQKTNVRVIKVLEKSIIIDANHPLAGKNLEFEIKLLEII